MTGCPLDEAFNIDLQNVKIKKKKKDKLKGLITPEQLKPYDYNENVAKQEETFSDVKQRIQEIKAFDSELTEFYPVRQQERVIRRPEPVPLKELKESPKEKEDFVRISNEDYKRYKEYQQGRYSDNKIVEGFDRINDNFNDIILFALTGVFFIIFTDYIYKLGKKSY